MTPALDPDAAARVASFGEIPPMRQRGLAAVRAAIESAPLPDEMPAMARIRDATVPGPAGPIPARIYYPTEIPQPRTRVPAWRRASHGVKPFF